MKLSPDTLPRPRREVKSYTFTDPSQPEKPLTLWLRPLDPLEDQAALSIADDLIAKYVSGGFMLDGDWVKEPLPLHAVDGEPVVLSDRSLRLVARVSAMQNPPDPADKYTPEELIRLWPCLPKAFEGLVDTVYRMASGELGWLKDPPSGRTE